MTDLKRELQHIKGDVQRIHDSLEHLNNHSKVCGELVKESNLREASELFEHLGQIDRLVHEAQEHITHIRNHVDHESEPMPDSGQEPLDIDDLKHDASHTSFDLEDIHSHIEHLITHSNMCQDIISPTAQNELQEIKGHLRDIDNIAHELLEHIKDIRGEISAEYSEFVWSIPDGFGKFLSPTQLIDSGEPVVKDMALKLVDGCESVRAAVKNILCFTRDFVAPVVTDAHEHDAWKASNTLASNSGGACARSILACALARAVNIPAKIHFGQIACNFLLTKYSIDGIDTELEGQDVSISWPGFYLDGQWGNADELLNNDQELLSIHDRFIELGIPKCNIELDLQQWARLPSTKLEKKVALHNPTEYLRSNKYLKPTNELELRLFGMSIYTGTITR